MQLLRRRLSTVFAESCHRGVSIALVLMVSASADAGDRVDQPCSDRILTMSLGVTFFTVETVVVAASQDGEKQPVRGVRVFMEPGGAEGAQVRGQRVKAKSKKDGRLEFLGSAPWSVHERCKNGMRFNDEYYRTQRYVLRAKGCEDLVVELSSEWHQPEILMNCAGR